MSRLKDIRKRAGMTQAEVAKLIGLDLTNYNRLENGKTELTVSRMDQLAEIFDVPPAAFVSPATPQTRVVRVTSHVQAGEWAETNEWPEDDQYTVAVPDDTRYHNFKLYGLETRGPSMNRVYPERTVLVYADIIQTRDSLEAGRRYVVERERSDGLREATVKKLAYDGEGRAWLMPESDDPLHQQPIAIDGGEDDTIRIIGRIAYSVRRED